MLAGPPPQLMLKILLLGTVRAPPIYPEFQFKVPTMGPPKLAPELKKTLAPEKVLVLVKVIGLPTKLMIPLLVD